MQPIYLNLPANDRKSGSHLLQRAEKPRPLGATMILRQTSETVHATRERLAVGIKSGPTRMRARQRQEEEEAAEANFDMGSQEHGSLWWWDSPSHVLIPKEGFPT